MATPTNSTTSTMSPLDRLKQQILEREVARMMGQDQTAQSEGRLANQHIIPGAHPIPSEGRLANQHIIPGAHPIPSEGRKDDAGKLPWHLLPPDAVDEILEVLKYGADKYAPRNWEQGMDWSRPFSALMRHMWAWWRREPCDNETGLSHLAHAGCCILFLLAYELRKTGKDDRP